MQRSDELSGPAGGWTAADTESVTCCVCRVPGRVRYRRWPFALVQCSSCGLAFVSPRLNGAALQRLYDEPDYFDEGVYGSTPWSPAMLLQRLWTAGRLAMVSSLVPSPATLLEIGSGYGLFLDAARRIGYDVRGVELSAVAVAHARDALGLDVFEGQLGDSPSEAADVVCAFDTVEHVPDPLEFLRQVRRRVAIGGVLIMSLPYFSSAPARLLGARWWTLKPEQHITHFTPATLRMVAARAGFALTDVIRSPLTRANAGRIDSMVVVGKAIPI